MTIARHSLNHSLVCGLAPHAYSFDQFPGEAGFHQEFCLFSFQEGI